jgi:hypothetical protein
MSEHAAAILLDKLMSDADGISALHLARTGLREDRWGREYAEAIGQSSRYGAGWPMEQLAAFTMTHALIYGGQAGLVLMQTSGEPQPDREREANAAALAVLPRPFSATVDMRQNNERGDGVLRWSEPVTVQMATGLIDRREDGSTCPLLLHFRIPPGRAPLEIGSTLPSTTFMHLSMDGGVARWPYGYSRIHLFVNLGPHMTDRLAELWTDPRRLPVGAHC